MKDIIKISACRVDFKFYFNPRSLLVLYFVPWCKKTQARFVLKFGSLQGIKLYLNLFCLLVFVNSYHKVLTKSCLQIHLKILIETLNYLKVISSYRSYRKLYSNAFCRKSSVMLHIYCQSFRIGDICFSSYKFPIQLKC